ncbi:MAG: (Fe-S)-binding protein [Methanobacteriaceae archaeon]|nr:(Fe-S)-binding protein [Methanobacteriaceae archaeon]
MEELEYTVLDDGSLVKNVIIKNIRPCIATEGKVRVLMELDNPLEEVITSLISKYPPGKVNYVKKKKILTLSIYDRLVTLYPSGKVTMNKAIDKEDAVEIITNVMKTINQAYDDLESIQEDNKKIEDISPDISVVGPLDIYKCLPQTNCQECGEKTCMAFSMKILSGDKFLDDCLQLQEPWHQDQVECLKKTLGVEMMKIMGWEGY